MEAVGTQVSVGARSRWERKRRSERLHRHSSACVGYLIRWSRLLPRQVVLTAAAAKNGSTMSRRTSGDRRVRRHDIGVCTRGSRVHGLLLLLRHRTDARCCSYCCRLVSSQLSCRRGAKGNGWFCAEDLRRDTRVSGGAATASSAHLITVFNKYFNNNVSKLDVQDP